MLYEICYNDEIDCVIAKLTGELNADILTEYRKKIAELMVKYNCERILNDMRGVEWTGSFLEIFEAAKMPEEVGFQRSWKRATLMEERFDDLAFFETASVNRGYAVKVFTDCDKAVDWLCGKAADSAETVK
jgi:hypothetical protein